MWLFALLIRRPQVRILPGAPPGVFRAPHPPRCKGCGFFPLWMWCVCQRKIQPGVVVTYGHGWLAWVWGDAVYLADLRDYRFGCHFGALRPFRRGAGPYPGG
ncbi:hypothetical protein RxyAA322_08920 [Rubrobacter xylanophilus]|uniref:Uncharacterized protein n=1 Tax=Rubrobacter xylanophilus TaxID=49319 RepID=A0A510HGJ1_9ACTN|nr:hypothetical protein RxyAA322_08920 [Rubrobacter xylanophilus]